MHAYEPDIAAIILAAGRSSRMGAFKPLLPFGSKSVVESCVGNFLGAGVAQIVLVIGHRAEEVQRAVSGCDVRIAVNPDESSEMSASIAIGVQALDNSVRAVLITPADIPAVPPEVIAGLVSEYKRTGARIVQPEYEGRGGHPVLLDLSFRDRLLKLDPVRGLRAVFDEHREEVLRLKVATPFVVRDMDTADDYRRLHRDVFGYEPDAESLWAD